MALVLAAIVPAAPALAQEPPPSTNPAVSATAASSTGEVPQLPVSVDRIKTALAQAPAIPLIRIDDKPHFVVEVRERQKIRIEDLISAMDFKSGPAVPGGLYGFEQNRLAHPAVDNPLRQPYAAFSQSELLTIAIENLAIKYLGGRALNAVTTAERARAVQAARDEVQRALADFWAAQRATAPRQ